jgi:hypothetical protein
LKKLTVVCEVENCDLRFTRDTCSMTNRSILVAVCKYPTLEPI